MFLAALPTGYARLLTAKAGTTNGAAADGDYALCSAAVQDAIADTEADPYGGPDELIHWGSETDYAEGVVRGYTKFSSGPGACFGPLAFGVELSDAVLENLPGPDDVSVQPPPGCKENPAQPGCFPPNDQMWLDFSKGDLGDYMAFPAMQLNWNPRGHEPPGVYDSPHVDFHFYLVPQGDVMNISAGPCMGLSPEAFTAANTHVPEACFPGGAYMNMLATVPMMGNHYISGAAPEMMALMSGENGVAAWNETFIYGGFDGQITYLEPMVKRAYLMSRPDMCRPIPDMPRDFALAGFKPHTCCILPTDEGVRVELRDFSWYNAGCQDDAGSVLAMASYGQAPPGAPPLPAMCELPMA